MIQHYLYSEHRSWEKDGKGMLPWIRESLLAVITIDISIGFGYVFSDGIPWDI